VELRRVIVEQAGSERVLCGWNFERFGVRGRHARGQWHLERQWAVKEALRGWIRDKTKHIKTLGRDACCQREQTEAAMKYRFEARSVGDAPIRHGFGLLFRSKCW